MVTVRCLTTLALVLLLVSLAPAAASDDEYGIMHPDAAQLAAWNAAYGRAPVVEADPVRLRGAAAPNGSQDLLPYLDYIPADRNQGRVGNCWAWAGTGVLEIAHAVQTGVRDRLSVEYLDANYQPTTAGLRWAGDGGMLTDLASFYASTGTAVPWSNPNADYRDGVQWCADNGRSFVPAYAIGTDPSYRIASIEAERVVTRHVGREQAIANIKAVLDQGRAVWLAYYLPNATAWQAFYGFWGSETETGSAWNPDPWVNVPYEENGGAGGHAVLCVGYDDTDPNNRYWVMVNSWGTRPGRPNGLFRVSMDIDYDATVDLFDQDAAAMLWMTEKVAFAPSAAPTPRAIEALPYVITESGSYYLVRDQIDLSAPRAVEIRASNVVLNGSGHAVIAAPGTGQYGVLAYEGGGLANVTVKNLVLSGWDEGIAFFGVNRGEVTDCRVASSAFAGLSFDGGTRNVSVRGCGMSGNGMGVFIRDSGNATLERNEILSSTTAGILLYDSGGSRFVDNRLVNDVNVRFGGTALPNEWNGPERGGPNVVGGPRIGGNYWGAPSLTGWSDTHWDEDRDGFADGPYAIQGDGTNVDHLPLVHYVSEAPPAIPGGAGTPSDLDGDGLCEDVNGNGRADFADVTLFFGRMDWIVANEPLRLFDYNENGRVDFNDTVLLFSMI
ncbi:MAG: NosD domain-containing protein [Methanospirillum sp.]